jgi:hypothetical protein
MMATPAVAWGTNTETRPSPRGDVKRATFEVMSKIPGRFPVWTTNSSLITPRE